MLVLLRPGCRTPLCLVFICAPQSLSARQPLRARILSALCSPLNGSLSEEKLLLLGLHRRLVPHSGSAGLHGPHPNVSRGDALITADKPPCLFTPRWFHWVYKLALKFPDKKRKAILCCHILNGTRIVLIRMRWLIRGGPISQSFQWPPAAADRGPAVRSQPLHRTGVRL